MDRAVLDALLPFRDLFHRNIGQKLEILEHQLVVDGHKFAYFLVGRIGDGDVVAVTFRHLPDAVKTFQERHGKADLRLLPFLSLKVASDHKVEGLVVAAQLHVRL